MEQLEITNILTLADLIKIRAVAKVDFAEGVLKLQSSSLDTVLDIDKRLAKKIKYIFANGETNSKDAHVDLSSSLAINNVLAVQQAAGTFIGEKSVLRDSFSRAPQAKSTSSDIFTVTSVYDGNYVIDSFQLSTDELVSFDNSSLSEYRPTASSTTFYVPQLLSLMKDLQLRQLLKRMDRRKE